MGHLRGSPLLCTDVGIRWGQALGQVLPASTFVFLAAASLHRRMASFDTSVSVQAFCDGVCLISRYNHTAAGGLAGASTELAADTTLRVTSGPWYLDHVNVWSHGGTAITVGQFGTVLGRMSCIGGEADEPSLQAMCAVHCEGGTSSLTYMPLFPVLTEFHVASVSLSAASRTSTFAFLRGDCASPSR